MVDRRVGLNPTTELGKRGNMSSGIRLECEPKQAKPGWKEDMVVNSIESTLFSGQAVLVRKLQ